MMIKYACKLQSSKVYFREIRPEIIVQAYLVSFSAKNWSGFSKFSKN